MDQANRDISDDDVSSIADSIRSDYSLQSDMIVSSRPNRDTLQSHTKEQEARSELASSSRPLQDSTGPPPNESATGSSRGLRQISESTPLLGSDPPPTYTDAIAAGARAGDPRDAWRRNIRRGRLDMTTFSQLQGPSEQSDEEEHRPLMSGSGVDPQRDPESMVGAPISQQETRPGHGESARWQRRLHKRRRFRKAIKGFCAGIGLAVIIMLVVMLLLRLTSGSRSKSGVSRTPGTR